MKGSIIGKIIFVILLILIAIPTIRFLIGLSFGILGMLVLIAIVAIFIVGLVTVFKMLFGK